MLNEYGETYAYNLTQLGLETKFVRAVSSPLGNTFYFNLVNISQYYESFIKNLIKKLSVFHHREMEFVATKESHFAIFCKNEQSTLLLSQILNKRSINIGKDINGRVVSIDFNKAPHLLIAGTTGSGKSVLLHTLLVNILNYYGSRTQLVLIDKKGTELVAFKNCRNTTFVGNNTQKAISVLQQCEKIMDDRYRNGGYYHHEIFIVIDELADLILTSHYEVENSLVRIAQLGRACGIHLLVSTQSPRVQVCTGLLKSNLPYRICLKTTSVRESVVVFDKKGCETLRGNGDCYVKLGLEEIHTQIAYCDKYLENNIITINKG